MIKLCQELKSNPRKIENIKNIITMGLKSKIQVQQLIESISHLVSIFQNYFKVISSEKQQKTYQTLVQYSKSIVVMLFTRSQINQNNAQQIFRVLGNFFQILPSDLKDKCTLIILQQILTDLNTKNIGQTQNKWSQLRNLNILIYVLKSINKNLIKQNFRPVSVFLMLLDSSKNLQSHNQHEQDSKHQQLLKKFKQNFQEIFLNVLSELQNQSLQEKLKIYRKMGQKIFSKLSNPLILADYFINKFHSENQNICVQIQVLSSLFILVGKQGLQLQQFYETLQIMLIKQRGLKDSLFRQKNSKRFLKLLETSMRSSRVPFNKILALCKCIISKILFEESEFSFWALSFFVNLVKKHRQLQKNLHLFPQLQMLKVHYSPKIRKLIEELTINLDKAQYLDIQQFQKLNINKLCSNKVQSICRRLEDNAQQIQFKFVQKNIELL